MAQSGQIQTIYNSRKTLLEHLKYLALHNEAKKGDKYFWKEDDSFYILSEVKIVRYKN